MRWRRVLYWIQNLSLYLKMLLIITFACSVLLLGNYAVLQMVYHSYDEQLYVKTAQVFTSYVEQVETEFDVLNTLSLSMLGDSGIQRNMMLLRDEEDGSEAWLTARRELASQISSYLYNVTAFDHFGVYTNGGISIGSLGKLTENDKEQLADIAVESKGVSKIMMYRERLYFLRQIRQSQDFAFTNLGVMIGEIDIQKILSECGEIYRDSGIGLDLSVYVENECIYQEEEIMEPLEEDGWQIREDKFIVQCTNDRGWKFLIYTSYDEIHSSIRVTMMRSFLLTVAIAFIALFISYCLVARLTRQLDILMDKFDDYGKGVLPSKEDMEHYKDRHDEIGRLHRHFDRMAYEYKRLNDENYNRMLLQKEAQYKQLQQQIQPHFIFNTLSLITWMAYQHKDTEIAELSNALSRMLRETMAFSGKTVTVKDELKLVEDYMLIQSKRYEGRLKFVMDIPVQIEKVMIPQMTIQPIVENAVKYALEEMLDTCVIKVWGRIEGKDAVLLVEDNGIGIDEDIIRKLDTGEVSTAGNGIGLRNIQQRIQLIFSEAYGLEFHRIEERTQVRIRVPFEAERQEEPNV